MKQTADVIVIGIGGVGSAAISHLASAGANVIGIDRFPPGHDHGSSHGGTRIIRTAYFEHPDYVPLAQVAWQQWEELKQKTGQDLIMTTGLFVTGRPDSEAVQGTLQAAKQHGLEVETLSRSEADARWTGFRFSDDEMAVFEKQAGILNVEECVKAHARTAQQNGAIMNTGESAFRWGSNGSTVFVESDRGHYEAGTLIITAGAWAGSLLRGLPVELHVLRKVQVWMATEQGSYCDSPVFYFDRSEGAFYGCRTAEPGLVKVARHTGGEPVDDPSLVRRVVDADDLRPISNFAASTMTGFSPTPVRASTCLYTMSADGHFIVDQHPEHENVYFAAGLSGHGFKFTNVLGQALSDFAMHGNTELPVGFLSLKRFED